MMLGNRRNFIFRVSIVINIAVILYAAMHLSGTTTSNGEWIPVTADGSERTDFRYLNREDTRNETETRPADSSVRIFEESTSQKSLAPSTVPTTKKTALSTASVADMEKKIRSLELDLTNDTLDIVDENVLSDTTQVRLRSLLACTDREFLSQTLQRGEYWVLKNYVRADHGMIQCQESVTYTTHAGFEFLDNVLPLVER